MDITIYGPNLTRELQDKGQFHVHATGCAHGRQRKLAAADRYQLDVDCRHDVEQDVYDFAASENDDYELGDYQSEFHFAPCVSALPLTNPSR